MNILKQFLGAILLTAGIMLVGGCTALFIASVWNAFGTIIGLITFCLVVSAEGLILVRVMDS